MKILYLHQYFNTPDTKGSTRSYEMAVRMVKAGHEVHLITTDKTQSGSEWHHEVLNGINVHMIPVKYDNKMSFLKRILAFIKFAVKAGSKAKSIGGDVIFATSTPLTIAIPAVQAKKALKIPMVFEVRDLWPELPVAIGALKSPFLIFLAKKLELWAYRNADYVVGLSQDMCNGVIKTGFPENKVFNIPNSCDIALFDVPIKAGDDFRQQFDWLKQRPLVVYAGTLGRINGVSYLADLAYEMLSINPEVRFLVVGNGIDETKIKERAEHLGVMNNNFFMLPAMKKKDMPGLFSAATIATSLFVPLKEMWSNSANKFFDTLAAGRPIAINYQGWQKRIIENENVGIILDEFDFQKSAQNLAQYLDDEEALASAKIASKQLAISQFSRDKLAEKLINVLESTR